MHCAHLTRPRANGYEEKPAMSADTKMRPLFQACMVLIILLFYKYAAVAAETSGDALTEVKNNLSALMAIVCMLVMFLAVRNFQSMYYRWITRVFPPIVFKVIMFGLAAFLAIKCSVGFLDM